VFIPKRRKTKLFGALRWHVGKMFRVLARHKESEVAEGHLPPDYVNISISIQPKYTEANVVGYVNGKRAIQMPSGSWAGPQSHRVGILGSRLLRAQCRTG